MPNHPETGGYRPEQEAGPDSPELSIKNIRAAAEALKQRVEQARQFKEGDIAARVAEHGELSHKLLELRGAYDEAVSVKDYFETIKTAGELPADAEAQWAQITAAVDELAAKQAQIEAKINMLASQPEIFDRIHEQALKERNKELNEAEIRGTMERLLKDNDSLVKEIDALAQKERQDREEYKKNTEEMDQLEKTLRSVIKTATENLSWQKHGETFGLLTNSIPSVGELQKHRAELGLLRGREKGAIDAVLQYEDQLNRYNAVKAQEQERDNKWRTEIRGTLREALLEKIKNHFIKAWDVHDKTGIEKNKWDGVDVPEKVFEDLRAKIQKQAGLEPNPNKPAEMEAKINTPATKALRSFWSEIGDRYAGQIPKNYLYHDPREPKK